MSLWDLWVESVKARQARRDAILGPVRGAQPLPEPEEEPKEEEVKPRVAVEEEWIKGVTTKYEYGMEIGVVIA